MFSGLVQIIQELALIKHFVVPGVFILRALAGIQKPSAESHRLAITVVERDDNAVFFGVVTNAKGTDGFLAEAPFLQIFFGQTGLQQLLLGG